MTISSQLISSSAILFLTKLIHRGLGLISTLILARILIPDDFGLLAILLLTIQFFEIIGETGSEQYILQKEKVSNTDLSSAWSLNIIIKSIIWLIYIALVPLIVDFYDNPDLKFPLYIISFILIIRPLVNPGVILLKKNLQYKPIFHLSVVQKVVSFTIVMSIVYFYPSFWALIAGDIAAEVIYVAGSYFIHTFRPKITLKAIKEQWAFSQWMLFKSILGFTRSRIDLLMVTKLFDTSILGQFHVIKNITVTLGLDIIAPILEPLVTTFAKVKNDAKKLTYQVQITFVILMTIAIPISVFLYFFPFVIIDFLLGDKWNNTYDLMSALSIMFLTLSVGWFLHICFIALGNVKNLFAFDLVSLFFIFITLYSIGQTDIITFTLVRSGLAIIVTLSFFYYLGKFITFSYLRIALLLFPIVLSSMIAAYLTNEMKLIRFEWSIINLAFLGSIYFSTFLISLILTSTILIRKLEEYLHIKMILLKFTNNLK
jgi:lipopolysaccharide exporter